jgi:hypothetical protein
LPHVKIYSNADSLPQIKLQSGGSFSSKDSVDPWLVKVAPDNSATQSQLFRAYAWSPGPQGDINNVALLSQD